MPATIIGSWREKYATLSEGRKSRLIDLMFFMESSESTIIHDLNSIYNIVIQSAIIENKPQK
jgi:hypothetical protein